jgi:hypothetical protein
MSNTGIIYSEKLILGLKFEIAKHLAHLVWVHSPSELVVIGKTQVKMWSNNTHSHISRAEHHKIMCQTETQQRDYAGFGLDPIYQHLDDPFGSWKRTQ